MSSPTQMEVEDTHLPRTLDSVESVKEQLLAEQKTPSIITQIIDGESYDTRELNFGIANTNDMRTKLYLQGWTHQG